MVKTADLYSECPELVALLERCERGEPDAEIVAELESHIETCGVCREAEALIASSAASLRAYGDDSVSQEFETRLVDQLCRKSPEQT